MSEQTATQPEKREFQTEAKQLLHLMIHSMYSHKEVFVRELISNASDALDKIRFESLTNDAISVNESDLKISVSIDKTAKTFTITDNGIGMNRDEVVDNLGTIARSGSRAFLEKLTGDQKADSNLIGQFGVGFYSCFMVASRVKVVTKRAGMDEPAVQWESDGVSDYTISDTQKQEHGTEITLYLSDEGSEFVEDWKVRSVIKKYSDFIAFPIYMPDDKGKEEIVNTTKPIWKRSSSDVTDEQYEEFYKQALAGFDKPLETIHMNAEGVMEYSALLFIPEKAPFDLFHVERKHGVKLYVKRVFILDDCKELLPEYLRFVKGVVDSEDLPLNVSREILQNNPMIAKIKKAIVGKVLGKLSDLAEKEPEKYKTFWKEFGAVIKEGLHSDWENKDKLMSLLRFQSSDGQSEDDLISLKQYVDAMPTDQKDIYYITAEKRAIAEKSPHLEIFREKGISVLYLVDPVDEFVVPNLGAYEGCKFVSVTKGDLDLGELSKEEKKAQKQGASKLKKLSERFKNILSDNVKEVRVTTRLKDSPACLVADENDMGANMEKIMKAMGQQYTPSKRILEINGEHPILQNLNELYEKDPKDQHIDEWAQLLYDQSLIAEGQAPSDPMAYSKRVNELLLKVSDELKSQG